MSAAAAPVRASLPLAFAVATLGIAIFSGMDAVMKGLSLAIGAYNAGVIHQEAGERDAAIAWLEKAVALGDAKAATRLAALRATHP